MRIKIISNYKPSYGHRPVKMFKINSFGFKEIVEVSNGTCMELLKQGWKYETVNTYKKKKR